MSTIIKASFYDCGECGCIVAKSDERLCRRCRELLALRAEVRDLKARLKAAKTMTKPYRESEPGGWPELDGALDLRRKNWRKP